MKNPILTILVVAVLVMQALVWSRQRAILMNQESVLSVGRDVSSRCQALADRKIVEGIKVRSMTRGKVLVEVMDQ
jgi:hypothetical protein